MQHAGRVTNPAGIHGHINDLLFHVLGLARIGIVKQEGAPVLGALAAAVALLALGRRTMSYNIGPLARGTVSDSSQLLHVPYIP